jgi:hypothetical protein
MQCILGLFFTLVGFVMSFLAAVSDTHIYIIIICGIMTVTGVITYALTLVDFSE